jgi:hypothetical protein
MTVFFQQIGRDRKTWKIETESLSDETLIRSIKHHDALMSNLIAFFWSDDGTEARIGVGEIGRPVNGRIRVEGGAKLI